MIASTNGSRQFGYEVERGRYVLYSQGAPVLTTERVALVVDRESGLLHRHGALNSIEADYRRMTVALRDNGYPQCAERLVMFSGDFSADDLNACLSNAGYAGELYGKMLPLM